MNTLLATLLINFSVTIAWDANPETNIAGYRVHHGTASRVYSTTTDVGNVTSGQVLNLEEGYQYFFAVTAYDADGLESDYSEEVWYIHPIKLFMTRNGIDASLLIGKNYVLEKSYNLVDWAGSQYITPDVNLVHFTINMAEDPYAFYRLMQLDPNPAIAIVQSEKAMNAKIYRPTIPVIKPLPMMEKVKNYFRYSPRKYLKPRESKGAGISPVEDKSKLSPVADIIPPMPGAK